MVIDRLIFASINLADCSTNWYNFYMELTEEIKQKALQSGFCAVGITTAEPIEAGQIQYLKTWLIQQCPAEMRYLHKNLEKRTNPAKLLKNAQSVICVALNYKPSTNSSPHAGSNLKGRIANYALYQDYHPFIRNKLHRLADFITSLVNRPFRYKACVDSVPLAERALAQRAGLGFIGKNHMLINPDFGPQILLAELVTDLKLRPDWPMENNCFNCNKCIKACPTGALKEDGAFDAGKCVSFLTIEQKGPLPHRISEKIGARLFGCDDCILACPYSKQAPVCKNDDFKFYPERQWIDMEKIITWSELEFEKNFTDSPVMRYGLEILKRNAQICLNNIAHGARNVSS